jgi:hypothetical protein
VIMSGEVPCPDFDEATSRFADFLVGQNWPRQIMWIRAADVVRRPGQATTIVREEHAADGAGGGLKLSVAVPQTEGVVRWSSC